MTFHLEGGESSLSSVSIVIVDVALLLGPSLDDSGGSFHQKGEKKRAAAAFFGGHTGTSKSG